MNLKDLKLDTHNYRKHSAKNKKLIKKSIEDVGYGRSIVIDSENEVICGNGILSQTDNKTPIKVIETDGSELVVVKRTDLKTSDAKRKQLAIMDNSTSDSSTFDLTLLNTDFDIEQLQDFGVEEEAEEEDININPIKERLIITYDIADKEKLENLLCITSINQVVYEFKDGELV